MCTACARYCQLSDGQVGFCGVRKNIGGELFLLSYGRVIAAQIDPIEKKPVSHYMPGSRIFSIGTTGCNFMCRYCINYDLSQRREVAGAVTSPIQLVNLALEKNCQGMAFTYNEPEIFLEFARDIGVEAHRKKLFNIFVSNGYGTPDSVAMMSQFLDCLTVDFKGNGNRNFVRKFIGIPDVQPLLDTLTDIKAATNIHIEITDLVVPGVGDDLSDACNLAKWIFDNLGPDTPVHFLRFFPDYKMLDFPETPIETLEAHWEIAKKEGLNYVYIGNVPGHPLEHTYCPSCKKVIVRRYGVNVTGWHLTNDNRCKYCDEKIAIFGDFRGSWRNEKLLIA